MGSKFLLLDDRLLSDNTGVSDSNYIPMCPSNSNDNWILKSMSLVWTWIKSKMSSESMSVPIGTILPYAGSSAPSGYLLCQGQSLSRTGTYAFLFSVIGTSYGYVDDSHFNLPDLRECTPVGIGQNTTKSISDHDEFSLGEFKDDQFQSHKHNFDKTDVEYNSTSSGGTHSWGDSNYYSSPTSKPVNYYDQNDNNYHYVVRIGKVTRGKRLGVNYIIRYI